jgi:putative FmdB family regulatory protein
LPAYDYRCESCSHQYEKREGFDAPPLQECPLCGGQARRVIYAPLILFKAQGFYVTDNRKPSPMGSSSKEVESVTGGNGKSEGSTSGDKPSSSEKATEAAAAG